MVSAGCQATSPDRVPWLKPRSPVWSPPLPPPLRWALRARAHAWARGLRALRARACARMVSSGWAEVSAGIVASGARCACREFRGFPWQRERRLESVPGPSSPQPIPVLKGE